ncbi:MAG: DNA repair protein RecO [Alcanivorax sp.]
MEQWQDQSVVLAARGHGENGAIVSLLTRHHGRQAGYVRGASSSKNRGTIEIGNIVDANWRARTSENLGSVNMELNRSTAARIMHDPLKLAALQAACALCDQALPEREGHEGLYDGFLALLDILEGDVWEEGYVMWEIALLKELGFSLDLTRCAGGGDDSDLAYVSPKTGRAVSQAVAEPYKDKLLPLPAFLRHGVRQGSDNDIIDGLGLTRYFFEHWVFAHHNRGLPEARHRLDLRFDEVFARTDTSDDTTRNNDELGTPIHVAG